MLYILNYITLIVALFDKLDTIRNMDEEPFQDQLRLTLLDEAGNYNDTTILPEAARNRFTRLISTVRHVVMIIVKIVSART